MVKLLRRLVLFGTLLYAVSAIAGAVNSVQVGQGGSQSNLAVVLPTCVYGLNYPSNNNFACLATLTPTPSATPTATTTATATATTTATPSATPTALPHLGVTGTGFSLIPTTAVTTGLPFMGTTSLNQAESNTRSNAPFAYTVKNLSCLTSSSGPSNVPASDSVEITLMIAGVAQTLDCTVTAGTSVCTDTTHSVAVSVGNGMSWRVITVVGGAAPSLRLNCQFQLDF